LRFNSAVIKTLTVLLVTNDHCTHVYRLQLGIYAKGASKSLENLICKKETSIDV